MQQKYGFIMFDDIKEFESWIRSQKIKRKINRLQVHHMGAPDYSCWKTDEHFRRQNNIRDFHKNSSGFSDIAQHFSIFPDGKIMTGRSLNSDPAGITGWNTGAICVEIYGNFDKGVDIMTKEQRESVVACYAIMCKVFNLSVNSNCIRPHAWFKSDGTHLGTYKAGQSRKTCPGTNFMGYGNTKEAFESFYRDIRNYQSSGHISSGTPSQSITETTVNQEGLVNASSLNVRSGAGTNYSKIGFLKDNTKVVIVAQCSNGWLKIKYGSGYGYVSKDYIDNIKNISTTNELSNQLIVKIICDTLNVRCAPGTQHKITGKVHKGESYTIIAQDGDWGKLKSGLGWICMDNRYVQITHTPSQTITQFKNGSYEGKRGKIKATTLNVRSGRGTNYAIIGSLKQGEIVELSYCLDNWMSIPYKGGKNGMGYISTDYIEVI